MAFLSDFGAPIFGVLSVSVAFFALFYRCFTVLAERFFLARFCKRGLSFLRFGGAESLNFACFKALTSIFYASEYASRRGFDERDVDLL